MTGAIDVTTVLADLAFWLALEVGVYSAALRKRVAVLFVALWGAGHLGLPLLLPGEDLLAQHVLVLAFALVLTILTREVVRSDERSE
jgi:hypothetical protein